MLTKNMLQIGEGKLKSSYVEEGHTHRRRKIAYEEVHYQEELNFCKTFYTMAEIVGQLLSRLKKSKGKRKE